MTKGANIPVKTVPKYGAPRFVVVINKIPKSVPGLVDIPIDKEQVKIPVKSMIIRQIETSEKFLEERSFLKIGSMTRALPDKKDEKELKVALKIATRKRPWKPCVFLEKVEIF